jgi:hypothetical protein
VLNAAFALGLLPLGLLPLEGSGSGVTELPPTPQFEPKFGVHYMYMKSAHF